MISRAIRARKTTIVSMMLFLLCFFSMEYAYAEDAGEQKNVLIINSYHQGFMWTKNETDGVIDALRKSSLNISFSVENMDWKNYPEERNVQHLYQYCQYKYQGRKIDLLIAIDDAALEFALEHRENLFANAPVVFCGVNQDGAAKITSGHTNFTGILEVVDPTDTIQSALHINPSIKNVYILFDNSESGRSTGEIVMDTIEEWYPGLNAIPLNNLSYDELIGEVGNYDADNSIILITTYYSDVDGKILEFENVSREISKRSSVPVYHLYDLGLNNGAFGGVMMSGRLQGESAANLAIRILSGENPDHIPLVSEKITRKVFDYRQLERFKIPLSKIPGDSEVINKPFSFFETYKTLVLSVTAAFILLVSFVIILLFNLKQIKRMKKNLADSHEELTQTYEELAASEEELKQQFDEVVSVNEKLRVSEEKLAYLAYHDSLTGLQNRLSLYADFNADISIAQGQQAALLFIDIDHFKYINDAMGHAFGDQLIIKVSERLTSLLNENCSIYRIGGDEFIILVKNLCGRDCVEAFASQILAGFEKHFVVQNSVLHISLSIGIALFPEHGGSIDELLKYADMAMYKAKDSGRKSYVFYDRRMNEAVTEKVNMEKYLHKALDKGEFEIYYQPQLELMTNRITGFEALLRWKSPELGFVSPLKFIKAAEDTHLIIPLGAWVLKNACAFIKRMHEAGHTDLSISVNISILQLLQTDFDDMVMSTLDSLGLLPEYLELEITESVFMETFETIVPTLVKLHQHGIRIALDDFGKGYSSLTYLKQLPISTIKVDKSFIDPIQQEVDCKSLVGHIITIGKSMGMCVIAEGVEKQEQLEYLVQHACDKIQGYFYCRPIPEEEVIDRLATS